MPLQGNMKVFTLISNKAFQGVIGRKVVFFSSASNKGQESHTRNDR